MLRTHPSFLCCSPLSSLSIRARQTVERDIGDPIDMQKRVVMVSAAAATLGLAAAVMGFAAEYFKHKAFVRSDDASRCEYRRTPALGCGIAAALLSLTGLALVTAASRCFRRRRDDTFAAAAESDEHRRRLTTVCATLAWLLVAAAAAMFLYGAARNAGRGRRGSFTAVERQPGFGFVYRCPELRDGLFVSASISAGIGIACAVAAYIDLHKKREQPTVTLGAVAMGQPYPPAPVASYPARPPYGGGYGGAKQPAGAA